jgi:hypothetical protein
MKRKALTTLALAVVIGAVLPTAAAAADPICTPSLPVTGRVCVIPPIDPGEPEPSEPGSSQQG